jgi:hypothetical protein
MSPTAETRIVLSGGAGCDVSRGSVVAVGLFSTSRLVSWDEDALSSGSEIAA